MNDTNGRVDFYPVIHTGRPEPACWLVQSLGSMLGVVTTYPNSEMKTYLPTSPEGRARASEVAGLLATHGRPGRRR